MLCFFRVGVISLGVGALVAGCTTKSELLVDGGKTADAGDASLASTCGATVATYCAANVSKCVLSSKPDAGLPCSDPGWCSFESLTLAARQDPANPAQTDYYDAASGALVAIVTTSDGQCVAGPPGFRASRCAQLPNTAGCCPENSLATFMPSWKPPTRFRQGKCTDVQIAAFVDCSNGQPDASTCKTFTGDAANKSCLQCADTPATAAAYGPLVSGTVTIEVNVSGCIALATGDVTVTGCGAKVLALSQCEHAACETNCPVGSTDTGVELTTFLACQMKSDTTVCKTFADDAACAASVEGDGGVAAMCAVNGATFADNAVSMIKLFCGGIVTDAGPADAGDGG